MIIKSSFRPFWYYFTILAFLFGVALFLGVLLTFDFRQNISVFLVMIGLSSFMILAFGGNLLQANLLYMNTESLEIRFKNRFTGNAETFHIHDFQGKMTCFESVKGETVKNIFLIKDDVAIKKISGLYYKNFLVIEELLSDVPDLGHFSHYSLRTIKMKLGLRVL